MAFTAAKCSYSSADLLSGDTSSSLWLPRNIPKFYGTGQRLQRLKLQQRCSSFNVTDSYCLLTFFILQEQYLSLEVKGQASNAMCVHILEDGHGLHSVGVPHTDVRLLAHLSRGHQHSFRMES